MSNFSSIDLFDACSIGWMVARSVHWRLGVHPEVKELRVSLFGIKHPLQLEVNIRTESKQFPSTHYFELDANTIPSEKTEYVIQTVRKLEGIES